LRLTERGVICSRATSRQVRLVRFGNWETAHLRAVPYLADFVADTWCNKALSTAVQEARAQLMQAAQVWVGPQDGWVSELSPISDWAICDNLCALEASVNNGRRAEERARRAQALKAAEVVCCTLSGAGGELTDLASDLKLRFDVVVVDESAATMEPAVLEAAHLLHDEVCPPSRISNGACCVAHL
jgi:AAA domain